MPKTIRIENAPQADVPAGYARGEKVVIQKGDVVPMNDAQMRSPGVNVKDVEVEVLGENYVSGGGPNRGEVVQQVREPVSGKLLSVPVSRLGRRQGERGCSRPVSVGWRAEFKSAEEAEAAARAREQEWEEVRPGVKRLVRR